MSARRSSPWEALEELRTRGRFPRLVIVTDDPQMPLRGTGALTIEHPGKAPMPSHLLADLDVVFWFNTCLEAGNAYAAARERGVRFSRARCFCRCACMVQAVTYDCDNYPAMIEWLERAS
jgi:hypothetical protein